MQASQQLQFVQQKVSELQNAILFNLSDSVLRFPNALISSPEVDDYGYLWFRTQKPKQSVQEFEHGFPVRLDFYRKGSTCFLQVSGQAWVVTDPEQMLLATTGNDAGCNDMVLLKVKMQRADYHETATAKRSSWFTARVTALATWFRHASGNYAPAQHAYFQAS